MASSPFKRIADRKWGAHVKPFKRIADLSGGHKPSKRIADRHLNPTDYQEAPLAVDPHLAARYDVIDPKLLNPKPYPPKTKNHLPTLNPKP